MNAIEFWETKQEDIFKFEEAKKKMAEFKKNKG